MSVGRRWRRHRQEARETGAPPGGLGPKSVACGQQQGARRPWSALSGGSQRDELRAGDDCTPRPSQTDARIDTARWECPNHLQRAVLAAWLIRPSAALFFGLATALHGTDLGVTAQALCRPSPSKRADEPSGQRRISRAIERSLLRCPPDEQCVGATLPRPPILRAAAVPRPYPSPVATPSCYTETVVGPVGVAMAAALASALPTSAARPAFTAVLAASVIRAAVGRRSASILISSRVTSDQRPRCTESVNDLAPHEYIPAQARA